jgi:hypothetical protein
MNTGSSLTNQNQIINNQFITMQRWHICELFVVKFLLLVCCTKVKFHTYFLGKFYFLSCKAKTFLRVSEVLAFKLPLIFFSSTVIILKTPSSALLVT